MCKTYHEGRAGDDLVERQREHEAEGDAQRVKIIVLQELEDVVQVAHVEPFQRVLFRLSAVVVHACSGG